MKKLPIRTFNYESPLMINSLSKKYYEEIIVYDLILKQNYKNIMQLSKLEKIVLNTSSKIYTTDKKSLLYTLVALELVSGQKAKLTYARKSIANFKIRQDQILGCKVILQQNFMYTFLDKFSKILIPRIIESSMKKKNYSSSKFLTLKLRDFNNYSTFNFGLQNMMIFPELETHYELVDNFRGMNFTFVFSNSNQTICSLILSGFQLPF